MNRLRNIKYNIKYKIQKAIKGYCDEDLFSIDGWFIKIFPKMLQEFLECTCGHPCNEEELIEEVEKMPKSWIRLQKGKIIKILKKYDEEFDINNGMCCWLLIILRLKYCFEMCSEDNENYEEHYDKNEYEEITDEIKIHKKEAFYLFEKYFFDLWW